MIQDVLRTGLQPHPIEESAVGAGKIFQENLAFSSSNLGVASRHAAIVAKNAEVDFGGGGVGPAHQTAIIDQR